MAGCTSLGIGDSSAPDSNSSGQSDTDDIYEVIAVNTLDTQVELAVRIENSNGTHLLSRVYRLSPDEYVSAVETKSAPASVVAFTASGRRESWQYSPPTTDADPECDARDVQLTVGEDLRLDYPC